MLRITRTQEKTLRLEGRLTRYEVGLLRETLRSAPEAPPLVDLTDLAFLDPVGAAALAEIRRRGAELRGGSAFVRELLKEESP
jgi:anti-anti-sigma regulatory factor